MTPVTREHCLRIRMTTINIRPPFKTEQDFSQRLAATSECVRIDYFRRLDQASVSVLAARLEKEQSTHVELLLSTSRLQVKKVNIGACCLLLVLAAATLALDLPYGRAASWITAAAWASYVGASEFFFLPYLRLRQAKHWNDYQRHAREWTSLLGNRGFAEHMAVSGAQFLGEAPAEAETVDLAIRGFALVQAERAARR
jgi:hypothetical protein